MAASSEPEVCVIFSGAVEQIKKFNFVKTLLLIGPDNDNSAKSKNGTLIILSCSQLAEGRDLAEETIIINSLLPAGISVCGFFLPQSASSSLPGYVTELINGEIATNLFPYGRVLLLFTKEDQNTLEDVASRYDIRSRQQQPCDLNVVADCSLFCSNMLRFRVRSEVSMNCHYVNKNELPDAFLSQYACLKKQLQSPATLYHIEQSNILIGNNATVIGSMPPSNRIQDVLQHLHGDEDDDGFGIAGMKVGGGKKNKKVKIEDQVLDVKIVFRTGSVESSEENRCIPIVQYREYDGDVHHLSMSLPLDVVVMAPASAPFSQLGALLFEGVCRQLRAMEMCIARHYTDHNICRPQPYHFHPAGLPHMLTVVYPSGVSDSDLESTRQSLHQQFILPLDRPLLRRLNAYDFPDDKKNPVYLMNTHIGLPPSGVPEGRPSLVYGNYTYHHYMQDKFNDDKWGCAYRSLQTLCSWFKLQGYVNRSIPTHREIQQALVDVGDKPAKFVGSRQWIGSIEVSTVLNQLLGVTSKIMFVRNGEDLATKGRELALHFEVQGTPVMIGGGVLAHTILGVDFSEKTGDLKFLILDPHYTGAEDLKTIHDKGWCGWKGTDFWDKTAYYNLCLPQRPSEL